MPGERNRFSIALQEIAARAEEPEELSDEERKTLASELLIQHAELLEEVGRRQTAQDHPIEFSLFVDPDYVETDHLRVIGDHLQEVRKYIETKGEEGIGRLIITVPPRHGKTLTVSQRWPAQLLGLHNDWRIALVSYGADLATDASRALRAVIRDLPEFRILFPHTTLSEESTAVQRWALAGRSINAPAVVAVGVGGPLVGRGFHLIVIDDPLKGRVEAESEAERSKLKLWYRGTLRTRLEPGGAIVIIQTRWHEDDLVGYLLDFEEEEGGEEWTVLNLPAIAEETDEEGTPILDPLGRAPGEALWPERYDSDDLALTRRALGPYDWSSQYQGRPSPAEGAKIRRDWLQTVDVDEVPKGLQWVRYWDLAISTKDTASYTASARCAFDQDGNLYISGMMRGRWEWPEQRAIIKAVFLAEKALGVHHGIEKALHGTAAVQGFRKDEELQGVSFEGIEVQLDKLTRALPWIALAADGMVYMVRGPWIRDFVSEAVAFTGHKDKHDDQIDAVSGAVKMLAQYSDVENLVISRNPLFG